MPTSSTFEDHLEGLLLAAARLRAYGEDLDLDTPVPTTPKWTLGELVAHLGMVHRWATAHVAGRDAGDPERWEREGLVADEPLTWLGQGVDALRAALLSTPADAPGRFFLPDAPGYRDAWARRQCHETTVHAIDAMSAHQGRVPTAAEADLDAALAADGVDEMLTGFAVRHGRRLTPVAPLHLTVRATDTGDTWSVRIERDGVSTRRGDASSAGTELSGTATQLYLGLWNRGAECTSTGVDVPALWSSLMQVGWS